MTYISANLTDDTRAHEWYKEIILSGAKESKLPKDYIAYLERLTSKSKEDSETVVKEPDGADRCW